VKEAIDQTAVITGTAIVEANSKLKNCTPPRTGYQARPLMIQRSRRRSIDRPADPALYSPRSQKVFATRLDFVIRPETDLALSLSPVPFAPGWPGWTAAFPPIPSPQWKHSLTSS
jgi:hypothetical protein